MDDFSLVPVEHQPDFENVSLVPVDHDPFDDGGNAQQVQAQAQLAQTQPQSQAQQLTTGAGQPSASTTGAPATEAARPSSITAGTNDFFRSIPRGVVSGFNTAASALGRAAQAEMGQDVDAPTPAQGMQILEKEVTGPLHRPEGRPGKFGASIGEFLGYPASYLAPGSLPFKAGTAVLGAWGAKLAVNLVRGLLGRRPSDSPAVRSACTWHHIDDFNPQSGMGSLELVDEKAHNATNPHTGSVAQYEKHHGVRYKR